MRRAEAIGFAAVQPLGRRAAFLLGLLAFAVLLTTAAASGRWRGDFRIDEAHKISETAFLRLWLRGDVSNDAWFANVVDRTNPPAGKYLFGAAILLSGQALPPLPTLAAFSPNGFVPAYHPEHLSAPLRPLLGATRAASSVATALTAALLTALLARRHSAAAATIGLILFATNFLTRAFWSTAVFDPLFSLFFMLLVALATSLDNSQSRLRIIGVSTAIGVAAAITFQIRLNGLFGVAIAVLFAALAVRRSARTLAYAAATAMASSLAATLLLNPYYWSTPASPIMPFAAQTGMTRPIERLLEQKRDLETLAGPIRLAQPLTFGKRLRFLSEVVFGDLAGLLLAMAAATGVLMLAFRWRAFAPELRRALLMSIAVVIMMVVTLPLPWPRYLLVVVPPLAFLAAVGVAEAGRSLQANRARR